MVLWIELCLRVGLMVNWSGILMELMVTHLKAEAMVMAVRLWLVDVLAQNYEFYGRCTMQGYDVLHVWLFLCRTIMCIERDGSRRGGGIVCVEVVMDCGCGLV